MKPLNFFPVEAIIYCYLNELNNINVMIYYFLRVTFKINCFFFWCEVLIVSDKLFFEVILND